MHRRILQIGLRLLGPALLIVVVLRLGDPERLRLLFSRATLLPLLGVVALNAVNLHLKVVRFQRLLRARGYEYPLRRAWSSSLSSMYIGLLTPGRVGDVLRVQFLHHDLGLSYAESLAYIAMDRFCDIYVILGFCAFGIARFAGILSGELAYATYITAGLCALLPTAFLVPRFAEQVLGGVFKRLSGGREPEGLRTFLKTLHSLVGPSLLTAFPLTILAFLGLYTQGFLVAKSLGLPLSLYDTACFMSLTGLLSQIPISITGLGVRELFLALVFPALGIAAADGVAFGLAEFAVIHMTQVAAAFVCWQFVPPPVYEEKSEISVGDSPKE